MMMMILGKTLPTVLLLFLFLFTAPSTADIISVKIRSHNRDTILFSKFEFSPSSGYVSVAVSSVGISSIPVTSNSSQPDPSRIGFFLLSNELLDRHKDEFQKDPDLCPLDLKFVSLLFTFQHLSPQSSFNKSCNVTYPGLYSLYLANCNDLSLVTMDVRTELYNNYYYNTNYNDNDKNDDDDVTKDYLSAGQPQPSLYYTFFLIYICFLVLWISLCLKNPQCFHGIHLLMSVLLVLNLLHFISAVVDQHDIQVTGTLQGWHHVLFYVFQFARNVVFFELIGAGWCFWKPFLGAGELFFLTVVIILQAWANGIAIMVAESGPYDENWLDLKGRFTCMDSICCILVFLHSFSSAFSFQEEEATDSSTPLKNNNNNTSSVRPDVFPFLFLLYMVFTRSLFIGLTIPREITVAQETSTLLFSLVIFCMYRPFELEKSVEYWSIGV